MSKSKVNPIFSFIHSTINIGVDPKVDTMDSFYIKFINVVSILSAIVCLMALPVVNSTEREWIFYAPAITMWFFCIVALYCNHTGYYTLAKLIILFGIPIVQFLNLQFIDTESKGVEVTLMPLAMVAAFIFKEYWLKMLTVGFLITLFCIVFIGRDYQLHSTFIFTPVTITISVIIGTTIVFNHLTNAAERLKKYIEQLKNQNNNLEKLVIQNDLKTELLGILSHDLKGPATAFNQLSKKVSFLIKKKRYDELIEFGNYFEIAGDKIYYDIDRLLNWTIAQKKDIITREEEIAPQRLIDRIAEGLKYQVSDKDVSFNNSIPKDVKLSTDRHILEIILKNLLINAANHSADKGNVDITYSYDTTFQVVSINNKNSAIDMDIVAQARIGSYRKSKEGHGLGLGICFSLIKFLKGEIEFLSSDDEGTTVLVKLPVGD